jgi:hypothetical protein
MKKLFWLVLLMGFFSQVTYTQSIYDLVKGEEPSPIKIRGQEETAAPAGSRPIPSIQFGGGVDFTSKQGTSSSIDFQLGFMIRSFLKIQCVSFGPVVGIKNNSQSTSWKLGGFSRVDLPVIIKNLLNPFVKLSISYQDPGIDRPESMVLAPSFGGQVLLGDKRRKYAAVDIELVYQLANNKIFFRKEVATNHAFQFNTSLKVYL